MADARCTSGDHVGEDLEGRCSLCGDRIERPSLLLTVLVLVAVVLTSVVTVGAFLYWWLA